MAITIDDGPYVSWVKEACRIAKEYNATLTFFVCGQHLRAHPDLAPMLVRFGHEVENHSYNHPALPRLSADKIAWQIRMTAELIYQQTGQRPVFLRPPYGAFSRRTGLVVAAAGQRLAMWTVDPRDWNGKSADEIAAYVLARVRDGSVVLLHEKQATLKALPAILKGCQAKGLRCVSLRELWRVPGSAPDAERLAPLRALTDDHTHVDWNERTHTAVLRRKDLSVRLRVGDRVAYINGVATRLPAAPALYKGQLYVPDEYIAAALAETMESTEEGQRAAAGRPGVLLARHETATGSETAPDRPTTEEAGSSAPTPPSGITLTPLPGPALSGENPAASASVEQPKPSPYQTHLEAGMRYKRRREFAAAADELLAAVRCDPSAVEAHWALAWTLHEMHLREWAKREFQRVAQLDPTSRRGKQAARLVARES